MKSNAADAHVGPNDRLRTLFVCDGCGLRVRLYHLRGDPIGIPKNWLAQGDTRHFCTAPRCRSLAESNRREFVDGLGRALEMISEFGTLADADEQVLRAKAREIRDNPLKVEITRDGVTTTNDKIPYIHHG